MKRIGLGALIAGLFNIFLTTQAFADMLKVRIDQIRPSGVILVTLYCDPQSHVRVWQDGSEWGSARWRIHQPSKDGTLHTFFMDANRIYTVNKRSFHEVSAEKTLQVQLDINDGQWLPAGETKRFTSGDALIVVYDVPPTADAHEFQVWNGVVAAKALVP